MGVLVRHRRVHLDRRASTRRPTALGTLDELYVIAAAVIGGTSLAGGIGTIAGAMLGALVMQSLQSGMVLLGVDSPLQNIVVGVVLVLAVWLDSLYRRAHQVREETIMQTTPPDGTPLVEMRDISIAFGGVQAVDDASHRPLSRAKWSACSATTAPASRR